MFGIKTKRLLAEADAIVKISDLSHEVIRLKKERNHLSIELMYRKHHIYRLQKSLSDLAKENEELLNQLNDSSVMKSLANAISNEIRLKKENEKLVEKAAKYDEIEKGVATIKIYKHTPSIKPNNSGVTEREPEVQKPSKFSGMGTNWKEDIRHLAKEIALELNNNAKVPEFEKGGVTSEDAKQFEFSQKNKHVVDAIAKEVLSQLKSKL